ncbi:glycogen synthase, partial [Patescibacteria group bacterium]
INGYIAAEVTPLAKVGGLADVAGALPKALARHAVDVRIIMPKYDVIDENKFPTKKIASGLTVSLGQGKESIDLYTTTLPGSNVTVYLIDSKKYYAHGSVYFEKKTFVGDISDIHRFIFLSKAVIDLLPQIDWPVDVLHFQDWHTGLAPLLLELAAKKDKKMAKIKTLYTIHNMGMMGAWSADNVLLYLGLDEKAHPNLSLKNENGDFRLLEQGIAGADVINTVSPTYAKEILTPEFGLGLEDQLKKRYDHNQLFGILNGIDTDHFDPATDQDIYKNFSLDNVEGKQVNKAKLQKFLGLTVDSKIPLIGFVGRLYDQKGFDLLPPIADKLFKNQVQLVILGTGLEEQERSAKELESKYPAQVKAHITFDAVLAQRIYAGSDLFLMPSRFEPCGLGQMIAMRYGTPPIVNATGGLKDSVVDIKDKNGTGFVFTGAESDNLYQALERAIKLYANQKAWQKLIINDMQQDFSWDRSSLEYLKLYQSLVK